MRLMVECLSMPTNHKCRASLKTRTSSSIAWRRVGSLWSKISNRPAYYVFSTASEYEAPLNLVEFVQLTSPWPPAPRRVWKAGFGCGAIGPHLGTNLAPNWCPGEAQCPLKYGFVVVVWRCSCFLEGGPNQHIVALHAINRQPGVGSNNW